MYKLLFSLLLFFTVSMPSLKAQSSTSLKPIAQQLNETKGEVNIIKHQLFKSINNLSLAQEHTQYIEDQDYFELEQSVLEQLIDNKPTLISLQIPRSTGLVTLELYKVNILSDNYVLTTDVGSVIHRDDDGHFYRGIIKGDENSIAVASFFKDNLRIIFSNEEGNFVINPIKNDTYICYNDKKLKEEQPFECGATEMSNEGNISSNVQNEYSRTGNCVEIYFEVDNRLYINNGSSLTNSENYVTALFNEVATVYANENIPIVISEIKVWTNSDPYSSASSIISVLSSFGENIRNNYNGRLAQLLSARGLGGGVAWLGTLCSLYNPSQDSGPYSVSANLRTAIIPFPTYSWNVTVVSHELGHSFGSRHTQSCTWPGGAIDNCFTPEGGCAPGPAPTNGGTIMSYCHLSGAGINFNNGFGPLPGALIQNAYNSASCFTGCGTVNNSINLTTASNSTSLSVDGTNINLSTRIVNNGNAAAGASIIRYYLSTNTTINSNDILLGSDNVGILSPNSAINKNFEIDANTIEGIAEGTYFVGYIIDAARTVTESNENDNTFSWQNPRVVIGAEAGLPNLTTALNSISLIVTGTNVEISTRVTNNGNDNAGNSTLTYYLSLDQTITSNDIAIGSDAVRSLNVNANSLEDIDVNVANNNNVAPGTYHVGYIIDSGGAVNENNENDNTFVFTNQQVTVEGSNDSANLLTLSGSTSLSVDGTEIDIRTRITNNGNNVAGNSVLTYYLSLDQTITSDDIPIGDDFVSSLNIGQASLEIFNINLGNSDLNIEPGTYCVGYIIDSGNEVAESNESDNTFVWTDPQVMIDVPPGTVNLRTVTNVASLDVDGTLLTAMTRVINDGTDSSTPCVLRYYLSTDAIINTNDIEIESSVIDALNPDETSNQGIEIDVSSFPTGTYYVGYIIDADGDVAESNENDNTFVWTNPLVTITNEVERPNLTREANSASLTVDGTNISVLLRIINDGQIEANAFTIKYYLSRNPTVFATEYAIGSRSISGLVAGQGRVETISIDANQFDIPPGTYYVVYMIDADNQVEESNEEDNDFYWSNPQVIINGGAANLTRTAGSANLSISGTNVTVSTTVINLGDSSAGASTVRYYLASNPTELVREHEIGSLSVPALNPNSGSDLIMEQDVSELNIPSGTYYVCYIVDADNNVAESDETDNDFYWSSRPVTITDTNAPNLTREPGSASLSITGTTISVSTKVINNGNQTASASKIRFYLASNPSELVEEHEIDSGNVSALNANSGTNISISKNVNNLNIPPGTYYVCYVVDADDDVAENDESDNDFYWSSRPFTITDTNAPNLTRESGSASLSIDGTTISVSTKVINNGSQTASASKIRFYLASNPSELVEEHEIDSRNVSALSAGSGTNISISKNVNNLNIPSGTYYICYVVDADNDVAENDETDNDFYWSRRPFTITGNSNEDFPNLTRESGSASLSVNGSNLSVSTRIINNGSQAASSSRVRYYLATNPSVLVREHEIGSDFVSSLDAGDGSFESINVNLNTLNIPAGVYKLCYIVDADNQVTESNESDNDFYWSNPTVSVNFGDNGTFAGLQVDTPSLTQEPVEPQSIHSDEVINASGELPIIRSCSPTAENSLNAPNFAISAIKAPINLTVIPNPLNDFGLLKFNLPENQESLQIQLMNMTGKVVKNISPSQSMDKGQHQIHIDVANVPKGIYFVTIQSTTTSSTAKIIVHN